MEPCTRQAECLASEKGAGNTKIAHRPLPDWGDKGSFGLVGCQWSFWWHTEGWGAPRMPSYTTSCPWGHGTLLDGTNASFCVCHLTVIPYTWKYMKVWTPYQPLFTCLTDRYLGLVDIKLLCKHIDHSGPWSYRIFNGGIRILKLYKLLITICTVHHMEITDSHRNMGLSEIRLPLIPPMKLHFLDEHNFQGIPDFRHNYTSIKDHMDIQTKHKYDISMHYIYIYMCMEVSLHQATPKSSSYWENMTLGGIAIFDIPKNLYVKIHLG